MRPWVGGSRKRSIYQNQSHAPAAHCSTYAFDVFQGVQLWTQATMYAQKLLIHDSSQGQGAERFHASIVYFLRVFVLALEFEGEIICQMPTLMVSSQEP